MNIYEAMEQGMLALDKHKGHVSSQLRGICESIAPAWNEIPNEWRERLYKAVVQAAQHFYGIAALKPENSPPPWFAALVELQKQGGRRDLQTNWRAGGEL